MLLEQNDKTLRIGTTSLLYIVQILFSFFLPPLTLTRFVISFLSNVLRQPSLSLSIFAEGRSAGESPEGPDHQQRADRRRSEEPSYSAEPA